MSQYLVRIKPDVEVDSYNGFLKAKGWYVVDDTTAKYLRTVKTGDHQPNLPLVFDVMTREEARVAAAAEALVEKPIVGTPDAPLGGDAPPALVAALNTPATSDPTSSDPDAIDPDALRDVMAEEAAAGENATPARRGRGRAAPQD